MQPCVELAPPVELVPSAGGAQDPDRLSVSAKHPLQIVARARALFQRLVDSVGLLLVGRQQASIPRVQEIEDGQGALRVASLGLPELWQRHGAKLGADGGVPLLSALQLCDRLGPRVPQRQVAFSCGWIILTERLDEIRFSGVVTKLATRLRVSIGRRQKNRQQRDSDEEHVRRQPGESHAPVALHHHVTLQGVPRAAGISCNDSTCASAERAVRDLGGQSESWSKLSS